MTDPTPSRPAVACPFCSLVCDDLAVAPGSPPRITANGCARARQLFERPLLQTAPALIDGRPVERDAALARAAGFLRQARQPLIAGLGADVAGVRAALELAEHCGAIVDPMNGDALFRNLRTLQQTGWITGTLGELRNRADVVLLIGDRLTTRFPRLVERTFGARPLFVGPGSRQVFCLGGTTELPGLPCTSAPFDLAHLPEVIAALRALLQARRLDAGEVAGVPIATLATLADRLRTAQYSAVLWAAADLEDAGDELAVQALAGLVRDLNETTRCIGVPLAGGESDQTAQQVTTWLTGYPGRISFARGVPDYDPDRFATTRLLAAGEADLLLWISAFDPARVPPAGAPAIVLGPPDMRLASPASVFLPVATPGLHHAGHLFRTDSVVTLPLRRLSDTPLPSAAHTLRALRAALAAKEQTAC